MAEYWHKRFELPEACTAATAASSDEEDDNVHENEDDDDEQDPDDASSMAAPSSPRSSPTNDDSDTEMESPDEAFAKFRAQKAALARKSGFTEWDAELRSWTRRISESHTQDMDLCIYWEVRCLPMSIESSSHDNSQKHAHQYPTIARIALDILPAMASSVPSERLFSSSGNTADDQRSRLGAERFEQAQIMKWHWKEGAVDFARNNQNFVEDVDLSEFQNFFQRDEAEFELDRLCSRSASSVL